MGKAAAQNILTPVTIRSEGEKVWTQNDVQPFPSIPAPPTVTPLGYEPVTRGMSLALSYDFRRWHYRLHPRTYRTVCWIPFTGTPADQAGTMPIAPQADLSKRYTKPYISPIPMCQTL